MAYHQLDFTLQDTGADFYYNCAPGNNQNSLSEQIDPNLDTSFSSAPMVQDHRSPTHMQEYLREEAMPPYSKSHHAGPDLYSMASGPIVRHDSPFSQQYSSSSSNMQSPPPESDVCTQGPATPSDLPAYTRSPHLQGQYSVYPPFGSFSAIPHPPQDFGYVDPAALSPESVPQMDGQKSPVHYGLPGYLTPVGHASPSLGVSDFGPAEPLSQASPHDISLNLQDEIHVRLQHDSLTTAFSAGLEDDDAQHAVDTAEETRTWIDDSPDKRPAQRRRRSSGKNSKPKGINKRRSQNSEGISHGMSARDNAPMLLSAATANLNRCVQCPSSFKDTISLQKHIKTDHTRPFTCVFQYAGCTSTFAAKNEWKRHVSSQHLGLNYWLCTHDNCATAKGPSTQQRSPSLPVFGNIFNRKDLFTQHIRRMHLPEDKGAKSGKQGGDKKDEELQRIQDDAKRVRCYLPTHMRCPAQGCGMAFDGEGAWDQRMEHVARHLDAAAKGHGPPVYFGGDHDITLTAWAESPGVEVVRRTHTGWELCNPLKGEGSSRRVSGGAYDEDAEADDM